jgi:hypothetical protein
MNWSGRAGEKPWKSGVAAGLLAFCAVHPSSAASAQDVAERVTGFARAPIHVAAWPAGRKVAVSFALFVEEFGFGQGPVYRPDLAARNPISSTKPFVNTRSNGVSRASAGCSGSWIFRSPSC